MTSLHPPPARQPYSAIDHAWLRMDEPTNLMMITGVLALGEPVDLARVKAIVRHRLLPIPRFSQKVVVDAEGPHWEHDPDFDLDAHVVSEPLPAPGDDAALRAVVSDLVSHALDPSRPLWSFHLFTGYNGGGAALFGRLHHAIGDGVALMMVLLSLTDLIPDADAAEEDDGRGVVLPNPFTDLFRRCPAGTEEAKRLAEQVMPEGFRLLEQSAEAFRSAGKVATGLASLGSFIRLLVRLPDPSTAFKGKLGVPKRVAWSEPLDLEEVKAVGKALDATINDVLLATMAGSLRRYLASRGEVSARLSFRAAMPVNLRPLAEMADLGNRFGLVFLSLPVGIADPVGRLAELRRRALALKRSAEPVVVHAILKLLGIVPLALQRFVVKLFAAKTTAVMTNVPGPRQTLYLAGKPIRDIFFWVPQSGRVGLGISIFSYAGRVRLGVGADAGLVPDPETIVAGFHDEFEELKGRLNVLQAAQSTGKEPS